MSNLDDTDEIPESNDEAPEQSTRRVDTGAARRRRRIPADDLPSDYSRPAISRKSQQMQTPPAIPKASGTPPQYYPPQSARPQRVKKPRPASADKRDSGLYLPWWSLIIMLAFVGCAAIGALLVVNSIQNNVAPGGQTPVVVVITSTFTVGPPATQTGIPQPPTLTPTAPLPTIAATASLPPGNFAIGEVVQVVGVGLTGLNVRNSPGTQSAVKFLGKEGDRFVLKDGPQTASNEEWWLIQDEKDSTRNGWASRRFLQAVGGGGASATSPR